MKKQKWGAKKKYSPRAKVFLGIVILFLVLLVLAILVLALISNAGGMFSETPLQGL